MLDIFATVLSGGLSTRELSLNEAEYGTSQVFIAMNLQKLHNFPAIKNTLNQIIDDFKQSIPISEKQKLGIPVNGW